jgi:hypothetical protein
MACNVPRRSGRVDRDEAKRWGQEGVATGDRTICDTMNWALGK